MEDSARARELELMVHLTLSVIVHHVPDPAAVADDFRARAAELAAHTDRLEDAALYVRVAREITDMLNEHIEIKRDINAILAGTRIHREVIHG